MPIALKATSAFLTQDWTVAISRRGLANGCSYIKPLYLMTFVDTQCFRLAFEVLSTAIT